MIYGKHDVFLSWQTDGLSSIEICIESLNICHVRLYHHRPQDRQSAAACGVFSSRRLERAIYDSVAFRQFSLRGLKKVTGEWTLVFLTWNLQHMAILRLYYWIPEDRQNTSEHDRILQ
jgi:hypothetical protein